MRWTLSLALLLAVAAAAAQTPPDATLLQPDADPFDEFGRAVALSGGTAAVGEREADQLESRDDRGAVSLFERQPDGSWLLRQRLFASDAQEGRFNENPFFGHALALDGDRLAVGAFGEEDDADTVREPGAVYVYERDPGGVWAEVAKVRDPDPVIFGRFGEAVALQGETLLVTASGSRPDGSGGTYEGGTVYAFTRDASGAWTLADTIQRPASEGRVSFGDALALDGDRALIGAGSAGNGRAYVYDRTGETWAETAELESPDPTVANNNKQFGEAVALEGDVALVGARGQGVTYPAIGSFASGAAYVFEREPGGAWSLRQRLTPDDIDRDGLSSSRQIEFGASVALEAGRAVIGAPEDDLAGAFDAGSAYVFESEGGVWTQTDKLRGGGREFTNFGASVALSGGSSVTGEPFGGDPDSEPGAAHVHVLEAPPPPPLALTVRETITVSDAPGFREALRLFVRETIGVVDAPGLLRSLQLLVREQIAVSDAATLAREGGDAAAAGVPVLVDTERVAFVGPVGLAVAFDGVTDGGGVTVFFEALAPEAPQGIPEGATLAPYRWAIETTDGLAFDSARVAFDPDALPRLFLSEGEEVAVYRRPTPGSGAFAALRTEVDAETNEIIASGVTTFSEFAIAGGGVIVGSEPDAPAVFGISSPMPNPARGSARLVLSLAEPGPAQVDVLDLRGRRIATLVRGELPAGRTAVDLRADRFAAGSYVVVFRSGGQMATARLTVVR